MHVPQLTLEDYEKNFADRHRLHDVLAKWARERPEQNALVSAESGRAVSWLALERTTAAWAGELRRMGFRKGDFLVTLLPMSIDHVLLEYSCFRLGVIVAPLDLRMTPGEILRALESLRPRGFAGLGVKGPIDLRPLWRAVQAQCGWIEHCLVADSAEAVEGTRALESFAEAARHSSGEGEPAIDTVHENDGALVIFTTGSTGSPKPALLSHRSITAQNMCLCAAFFGGDSGARALVNLPASHVGGQTEVLMTTLFGGGTAILLEIFDPGRSLRAIAEYRAEILGQIPAMFNLEWMLKEYDRHDLSSLRFAAYGGNAVTRPFLEKLASMAPVIGTGLGLTEASGWCTYVMADVNGRDRSDEDAILSGLGIAMPIYPCTIRQKMRADGSAGGELPAGETGHVCFRGPQSFLGYVNDPEATAKTISRDEYLYTGDLGYWSDAGLHLTGREKWVIKSAGYQIFPGDVEAQISALSDKVANCVAVGVAHAVLSEAVVAVVEKRPGVELTRPELERQARGLATYMRPRHWIILEAGQMPLNRVVKPDYKRAQEMARAEIAALRERGEWDSGMA